MARTQSKIVVEVEPRSDTGKNACRRLRRMSKLPANLYGLDRPPFKVAVNPRRIEDVLRMESGRNTVFTLQLGDSTRDAMIREVQRDPVTDAMMHIDFVRVDLTRLMEVMVPVRLIGVPEGVKNEGGVLDFVHRQVEVQCLPGSIPEHYDVDVTGLHLHQHISVSDLTPEEGVKILDDPEQIIAVVASPKAEEEAAVAEAAETEGDAPEPAVAKRTKEGEEDKADKGDKKPDKKPEKKADKKDTDKGK